LCDRYFTGAQQGLKEEPEPSLGLTNLFIAAMKGDSAKVKTEIGRGIYKVEPKLKSGFTTFWVAIKGNHYEVAEFILSSEIVDVNSVLKLNGRTVLFDLVERRGRTENILKGLFSSSNENHIQVNITDKDQITLLHHAVTHRNSFATKLFLEAGISVNDENRNGKTALEIAVDNKDIRTVELLASINPKTSKTYADVDHINSKTKKGVIHNLVLQNDTEEKFEILGVLLDAGMKIDLQEKHTEKSALFLSVEKFLASK